MQQGDGSFPLFVKGSDAAPVPAHPLFSTAWLLVAVGERLDEQMRYYRAQSSEDRRDLAERALAIHDELGEALALAGDGWKQAPRATESAAPTQEQAFCYLFHLRTLATGSYELRDVIATASPSMDIQVSSNFERFLYYSLGRDPARVREVMAQFKATGAYTFAHFDRGTFSSSRCTDGEIEGIIRRVYREHGYIVDPHTACGFKELNPDRVSVVLSTAHPAKFPDAVEKATGVRPPLPAHLADLFEREERFTRLPNDLAAVQEFVATTFR